MDRCSFLSPSAKRPSAAPDPDSANGSAKRVKAHQAVQHPPLSVPPGNAVFRMLCHISQVGGVIGRSGNIIKQLQQSTGAKIRVEESPHESPDRVITVIAQAALTSKMKLELKNPTNEEEEEIEISKAQEALVRVFELVIGVEVVSGLVSCRLLTDASHAGAVIGKGGKVVEKIRKETGCKISVSTENLPVCAEPDDEMVEIEGDVLAVKKALVSVSRCLQDCQPINMTRMVGSRPLDRDSHGTLHRPMETVVQETPQRRVEVLPRDSLLRSVDILSPDVLRQPIQLASRDALHRRIQVASPDGFHRPIQVASQDAFHRPIQVASQDTLHRPIERFHHDSLRSPVELFPRDTFLRRIKTNPRETFPELSVDLLSHRSSVLNTPLRSSITTASVVHPVPMESSAPESKTVNQEVVFKILCSTDSAGGVIGKGGAIIRALQSETGTTINVGNTLPDCDERLITVTASENLEARNSPAQKAVVLIFSRSLEVAIEKGLVSGPSKGSSITARLVVPSNQVGCLLGKGGVIISEMRKATEAGIQILKVEENPKCVSENDQVVQISGERPNVNEAIYHVTNKLRYNLFSNNSLKGTGTKSSTTPIKERTPQGKMEDSVHTGFRLSVSHSQTLGTNPHGRSEDSLLRGFHPSVRLSQPLGISSHGRSEDSLPSRFLPSLSFSQTLGRPSTLNHVGLSHSLDRSPSQSWTSKTVASALPRGFPDSGGGLASVRGGLVLGSGSKSALVTNTTVEIRVLENVMGFVYGENGCNLERLRKISGARVIVHEPHLGTSDRIIVISGTPDQTQAAQNLLHAFILNGETPK